VLSWLQDALAYLWYEFIYWLTMLAMHLCFSFRFEGGRRVPRRGPVLLIGNHQSFIDPVAMGLSISRHIHYLARKTLFKNAFFGRLLRSLNASPVDQEGVAKEGLRTVLEQLNAGHAVLIFPEGERTWKGKIQPLKPGIYLLIKRAKVPIVPIGIAGAYDALPRTRTKPLFSPFFQPATRGAVAVSVGAPLDARRYLEMSREDVLKDLGNELKKVQARAEKLRRKR
jgi:1-acyl-sn-glycerol-3-phosphate acyltransferase